MVMDVDYAEPASTTYGEAGLGKLTRRSLLAGISSTFATSSVSWSETETLRNVAAQRGIVFGCEVSAPNVEGEPDIGEDPAYDALIVREATLLVSNTAMKWGYMEWDKQGKVWFGAGEQLLAFAWKNGLKVRGHNLIWDQWLPPWFPKNPNANDLRALMRRHILEVAGHWKGRLTSWDVVNEAIETNDGRKNGLKNSVFSRTLGMDFLDLSYQWAREADPTVVLVYNDSEFEYGGRGARRRKALLSLLEGFRKRSIPCQAVGIQSHLIAGQAGFDEKDYRRFLGEIAAMGYKIKVTELDVRDLHYRKSDPQRAQKSADEAGRFLDVALDETAVDTVLTWGLSTKYSWLNYDSYGKRKDGAQTTGLPFDADFNPTPMYFQMIRSFQHAPLR